MAPELLTGMEAAELKSLAQRVREFQEVKKLSDSGMLRKFAALGSTTTYKKILNGQIEELDLERWLTNYRAVVALIEATKDDDAEEKYFTDMVGPLELKRVFLETSVVTTVARFILVQGDTGIGKSACKKVLIDQFGMRFFNVEGSVAFGDRPNALLGAILTSLGVKDLPISEDTRMLKAIEKLSEGRRGMLLDEGHHLGPKCLNAIKTIINQTPGEVILFTLPTLWNRLERSAYEECRQLTGNRLAERIRLILRATDVERVLEGRLRIPRSEMERSVAECMKYAPTMGNHGFVREVCKRALDQSEGEPVSFEILNNAITAERESR